jgi:hypothetical protein
MHFVTIYLNKGNMPIISPLKGFFSSLPNSQGGALGFLITPFQGLKWIFSSG